MGRLSPMQRVQVIAIYNDLKELKVFNKCKKVAQIANERKIEISEKGVRLIMRKWIETCKYIFHLVGFSII